MSALVTGATRRAGIAAAVAFRLAREGWNVATTGWREADAEEPWGSQAGEAEGLVAELRRHGSSTSPRKQSARSPRSWSRTLARGRARSSTPRWTSGTAIWR